MIKVTFVSADDVETMISVNEGDTLMQAAVDNNVDGIVGECCGAMMCATCHVYVDDAYLDLLGERSDGEEAMLECAASEFRSGSRLSCQITAAPEIDGIQVRMPESQVP